MTPQPTGEAAGHVPLSLTFRDEFRAPLGAAWNFDPTTPPHSIAASRRENAYVRRDCLRLDLDLLGSQGYAGARLNTRGHFAFRQGVVEFRAKLPRQRGAWAALWTMADPWPASGEIDVVESGIPSARIAQGHYHGPNDFNGQTYAVDDGTFNDTWHTFAARKDYDLVTWFINGRPVGSTACVVPAGGAAHWVCIDLGVYAPSDNLPQFSDRLLVDYVRVWE